MATPSLLIIPDRYKAAKLYSQIPESGAGDFTVTRGTTATRVNASGLIESVASGVPRIDYTGGGCGSLLVEPAATNLALRSEEFNEAIWVKNTTTVTANAETSPSGALTADTMTVSTVDSRVEQTTALGAGTYTFSVYVRLISLTTAGVMRLQANVDGSNVSVNFTPTTQWQRVTATVTAVTGVTAVRVRGLTFVGTIAVWGAQLETGSVATSYIPTVATTQTRNADVIVDTAVSGLIGQSQGTIYAEVDLRDLNTGVFRRLIAVHDGTSSNLIQITTISTNSRLQASVTSGGASQAAFNTTLSYIGKVKVALAYNLNDFVMYVNGIQIGTDTSGTVPATSAINLGSASNGSAQFNDRISAAALYTSRLSNAELIELTTL